MLIFIFKNLVTPLDYKKCLVRFINSDYNRILIKEGGTMAKTTKKGEEELDEDVEIDEDDIDNSDVKDDKDDIDEDELEDDDIEEIEDDKDKSSKDKE